MNDAFVSAVQLPQSSRSSSVSLTKTVRFRRSPLTLSKDWREESSRLEECLAVRQKNLIECTLPLRRAGWRLVREKNNWLVDYDLLQLFQPLDSSSLTSHFGMLLAREDGCELRFPEGDPPPMLFVNRVPISAAMEYAGSEKVLFERQLSLLSHDIFRRLLRDVGQGTNLTIVFEGAFSMAIHRGSAMLAHLCLDSLLAFNSAENLTDYGPTFVLIRKMLLCYFKGQQSLGLKDIFT